MQRKDEYDEFQNIYKVIDNASEFQEMVNTLVESSRFEVNGVFSTSRAFHRQVKAGADKVLVDVINRYSVKARILVPMDRVIQIIADNYVKQDINIIIKHIENNQISIVIVDRKHVFIAEIGDDFKDNSFEVISRMVYTNSPSTVSFYASIFESFWEQANLYERTRKELDQARSEMTQMKYYVNEIMNEMAMLKKQ